MTNKDVKQIRAKTNQSKLGWESVNVVTSVVKLAPKWWTFGVVKSRVEAKWTHWGTGVM